ncbi:preprotein translocase subunit SecE [Anaerotignum propionicum]|jgi:preprotein translocase subunit SecE|uniref:Protein translocase subunit SecE n=1 Tax=Anaerotignum propionicum DSM 1682 TaxID=991789 RepID=A0A0X8VEE8_ANAPI|nr:preprotein translocase subunit SecE [Anaerotignum propionicum]AMJ42162.1 protein translocase subunit SecE [Anaerotignum propionicum DSM 1682]MEA5056917.1 preprotein translocase subunit SecE [Anaerotignum propionicum]SHE52825.1 preprotein translocase subunit SecE [[Clostridium] propionicum DSM 1682] [Anaerotignum propionicum DSM 1682]
MEEKQNINQTSETKQAKPKQVKKNSDRDGFAEYKAEFKKIIWPGRPEIAKKTFTVIVTSLILGVLIFCMDSVFSAGYSAIIGLLG